MIDKKGSSKLPLWLSFACNELRVFGEFTTVTKKIQEFPEEFDNLIAHVIERLNSEIKNNLVDETLCLLQVSEFGLPEQEVPKILNKFYDFEIDKLTWSDIVRNIKPFIIVTSINSSQIMRLMHDSLHRVFFDLF
jgi:hypothetical protein